MSIRNLALALAAVIVPVSAHAAVNLVTNGSFETDTPGSAVGSSGNFQFSGSFGQTTGGGTVYDWASTTSSGHNSPFNLLYKSNNVAGSNAASPSQPANYASNQYGDSRNYLAASYPGPSPDGGNFVALDGDPTVNGYLTQTINGLAAGTNYVLSFYWAATQMESASGPTTEQLQASLGNQTQSTNVVSVASGGFQGWYTQTFTFSATTASEVLSFLSVGTPAGNPPLALLDGVSLVAAPEPATWALFAVGLGGIAVLARRRRRGGVALTA